jgi:hypothetical protein
MTADLETVPLGDTPLGTRLIANILSGTVSGERVSGTLLRSGADWLTVGTNGCFNMDVRLAFQAENGDLVYMTYAGRMHAPPEIFAQMASPTFDGSVDPGSYYFRTAPVFETASIKYAWLNQIVAIGKGRRTRAGVEYEVFEVL